MNVHVPALQRSLSDVVAEYDVKLAAIDDALAAFQKAGADLKSASTIGGTWGDCSIDVGHVYDSELKRSLIRSAWKHVYDGLNIARMSSAEDRRRWESELQNPPAFTLDNIRGTFGKFVVDPKGNILRALAEAFCSLDPFYKSHERVKIGVKGLPKRVILSNIKSYGSYGRERLRDVLNALAAYEGKPQVEHREIEALLKDEEALRYDGELPADRTWSKPQKIVGRDVWLRTFANGNGHLFFGPKALRSINLALAEFYGDVLPDAYEAKPDQPARSTAVSKDLQFYGTPPKVADRVVDRIPNCIQGKRWLDPSCGEGALLDALKRAKVGFLAGIEVDPGRAMKARSKSYAVTVANFLEHPAPARSEALFDGVLMNPPFYGRHYEKHVRHALTFVKPGGLLIAILPATARYDHGLLDDLRGSWDDLPVGSFAESGTNVNTTVLTVRKPS